MPKILRPPRTAPPLAPLLLAAVLLAAGPGLAADDNYNTGAASTANSGTANCQSALLRDGCGGSVTEAPLPLAGAGLFGLLLMGGVGGAALVLRRRRLPPRPSHPLVGRQG